MNKKNVKLFFLGLILVLGLFLRGHGASERYLWQDEAETTINSLQVIERGYPHGTFKGKPIYENASFIPSPSEKYEFESTNYYGTKYERNKGWLTYYWQALFLKLFGFSNFVARLPFLLLFIPVFGLIYLIGKNFFSEKVGILAAVLYSLNYHSIIYERQARYYVVVTFFSLLCFYIFYLALTKNKWRYYLLSAIVLILFYYTHLVSALCVSIFFILAHVYYQRHIRGIINKKLILVFVLTALCLLPWIYLVKFWMVAGIFNSYNFKIVWLFYIVVYFFSFIFLKFLIPKIKQYFFQDLIKFTNLNYLLLFFIVIIIFKPLIIVEESFATRQFLDLIPLFCLLFSFLVIDLVKNYYQKDIRRSFLVKNVFLIIVIVPLFYFQGPIWQAWDTRWVKNSIDYLNSQKILSTTPIVVSYQQLPFMLYTNYNIELVWPIRKSYLDSYIGEMYFIINTKYFWPRVFYRFKDVTKLSELNFYDKIQECDEDIIDNQTIIYHCPAK